MKAEAILINRPRRQGRSRRALFGLLTLLAWMIWLSLWLPLLTALAWLAGVRISYLELIRRHHGEGWYDLLTVLGIALVALLVAALWSGYNFRRFHDRNRRRGRPPAQLPAMAEKLEVPLPLAEKMRGASRMVLGFDAQDNVCAVNVMLPVRKDGSAGPAGEPPEQG